MLRPDSAWPYVSDPQQAGEPVYAIEESIASFPHRIPVRTRHHTRRWRKHGEAILSALTTERLKQSIQAGTVATLCPSYAIEIIPQELGRFTGYLSPYTGGAWFPYHDIQPLDPDHVTVFATEAEACAGDAEAWPATGRQAVLA